MLRPVFDQYIAQVHFNGGKPVFVPIHPPANASTTTVSAAVWKVDLDELRAAITPKTKMIWVNTPHNPVGKVRLPLRGAWRRVQLLMCLSAQVFDEEELRSIGNIAEEHNLLILSDEVVGSRRLVTLVMLKLTQPSPSVRLPDFRQGARPHRRP